MAKSITFFGRLIPFCFILFSSLIPAFGQKTPADTAFVAKAGKNAFNVYVQGIGDQANLYNGVDYQETVVRRNTVGNPYFLSDDWAEGSVYYDSGLYTNISMLYNLMVDKVILDQPFSHFKLELISEKIKYFTLPGHTFVRMVEGKPDSSLHTGFYDLLYNGKVKAYGKYQKEIKETTQPDGLHIEYTNKDHYFIFKNGRYYPVKSKSSVLKVFKDRKKSLRKQIKANASKINFSDHRDEAIATIAKLYDESEN